MVQTIYAAKIFDAALGGYAGAAKKDNALAFVDILLQGSNLVHENSSR